MERAPRHGARRQRPRATSTARASPCAATAPRFGTNRIAALLLLALAGCDREREPRPSPPTERVIVRVDFERQIRLAKKPVPPPWDDSRTAIIHEARDGLRRAFGEPVAFPVRASGTLEVSTAFAVATKLANEPVGRVACELRLRSPDRDELLATAECPLVEAAQTWRELRARVRVAEDEDADLVVVARWVGDAADVPANAVALIAAPVVRAPQPERRNVLVISVDTLRADHLGFHGYRRATSPRLDAFVARGALFEEAISTSPWTLPSYGTLFTGLEPARHRAGISARREAGFGSDHDDPAGDFQSLVPDVPTIAGEFASAGWFTGAIVANPFLLTSSRIDRGFDTFAGYINRAESGVGFAETWIEARGDAPWFLLFHLMDPHMPYTPPAPYDTAFAAKSFRGTPGYPPTNEDARAGKLDQAARDLLLDQYDGEIAYTDAQIGRLLDFLRARGELDETIVVIHADHGEEFWEHGSFEHGHSLHEELLHVPLAFVAPGIVAANLRVPGRTSTVDVFATVLDLAGLPIPGGIDGASRAGAIREVHAPLVPRPCVSEALLYGEREWKSWSAAGSGSVEKLVTDGASGMRLYDLGADAGEKVDLAPQRTERAIELRELLLRRARAVRERAPAEDAAAFDRDTRRDLEQLGYPGADAKSRHDPK